MPDTSSSRTPRFILGERVLVMGLDLHPNRSGIVVEVVESPVDAIYRYRVRLADGSSETFFGFELNLIDALQCE
jgi:hypothetical protein